MGEKTGIAWCHSTLNAWVGCTKFSAECANCYADSLDEKRLSKSLGGGTAENPIRHWGKGAPRHQTKAGTNGTLRKWNKKQLVCDTCGEESALRVPGASLRVGGSCWKLSCPGHYERRRVFIGSLMDWADEEVEDSWRDRLFDDADKAKDLTLMFLTKRAENAHRYLTKRYPDGCPEHFWIGFSWMNERPDDASIILDVKASVRFLSVEPMLGPLTFKFRGDVDNQQFPDGFAKWTEAQRQEWFKSSARSTYIARLSNFNLVIFGGESEEPGGKKARPCDVGWIRDGILKCRAVGAAPFVKQLGSRPCGYWVGGAERPLPEAGWKLRIKHPKGSDMAEWPEDVRVQELPEVEP